MAFDFEQQIPSIDQVLCNVWPEIPQDLYQKYNYYLVKAETEKRKWKQTWTNLITETVPWTPNMGSVMRAVIVEDAPIIRAEARPRYITSDPLEDIFMTQERIAESRLQWQDFSTPHFQFVPAFQDFMKGHLIPTRKTLERQIMVFEDLFYRTYAWDYSPYLYIAGGGLVDAPAGVTASGAALSSAKTAAWLQAQIATQPEYLTYQELFNAAAVFAEEVGATPYQGDALPQGDNMILDQKFVLLCSNEVWMQFTNDPWVKENRPLNMNIVNSAFKGPLFDTVVGRIELNPKRFKVDANFVPTETVPETRDVNPNSPEYNRTKPNSEYKRVDSSPYEIAWLIGGNNYKRVNSGPPPEFFAGPTNDPAKLAGMTWNGQVYPTRNFLIPCKDSDGTVQYKANDRGRYIKWQGTLSLGCLPINPFNVLPILLKRRRQVTTTAVA